MKVSRNLILWFRNGITKFFCEKKIEISSRNPFSAGAFFWPLFKTISKIWLTQFLRNGSTKMQSFVYNFVYNFVENFYLLHDVKKCQNIFIIFTVSGVTAVRSDHGVISDMSAHRAQRVIRDFALTKGSIFIFRHNALYSFLICKSKTNFDLNILVIIVTLSYSNAVSYTHLTLPTICSV